MKKRLKTIYDNLSQESSTVSVKVEPTDELRGYCRSGRKDSFYSSNQSSSSFSDGREKGKFNKRGQQNSD